MNMLEEIKEILTELLDIEGREITPETYLIRELGAESIDLLELAVALSAKFKIEVDDDEVFLKDFRLYVTEANQQAKDTVQCLTEIFPQLTNSREKEILADLEGGGALKVKDLIRYVVFIQK